MLVKVLTEYFHMRAFLCRAESFFGGKVDVLVNNAGVSPVLPFDTVMKVYLMLFHNGGFTKS